jgi:hypothetical protein
MEKNGRIIKVELIETKNIFESDMKLMDELENHYTIKKILENINKYWKKEQTKDPIPEILFNGKFKYIK